jgi:UDP-N-acetylglucosamine 4,6-dehydratase
MKYLIVGGTGSLGHEIILRLGQDHSITVLSRGELKQKELVQKFPWVKTVIGDVKDIHSLQDHFLGVDRVLNLAALKHVDVCEDNVEECIKTNLVGAMNVAKCAIYHRVPRCLFTSTDKGVLPITAYGYAKALASSYLLSLPKEPTRFSVCAYGNVLASRGSVVFTFVKDLIEKKRVSITHPEMTRFWITLPQAVDFVLKCLEMDSDSIQIPLGMKSTSVLEMVEVIADILGIRDFDIEFIGIRNCEKIHETIHTSHDVCIRSNNCERFSKAEFKKILLPIVRALT